MQMPDFEVNEGYIEAGRRRADSPRPAPKADERSPADARAAADGRSAAADGQARADSAEGQASSSSAPGAVEGGRKLPEETPIVRRVRHLAYGHIAAADSEPKRRVGVTLIARRRRLSRRACPYGWQVRVLGTPLRNRRRLWTLCHGQLRPPGSPS